MEITNKTIMELSKREPDWIKEMRLKHLEEFNRKEFEKYFKHGLSIILTVGDFELKKELIKKGNLSIKTRRPLIKNAVSFEPALFRGIEDDKFSLMHKMLSSINLIQIPENSNEVVEIKGDGNFIHNLIIVGKNSNALIKEIIESQGFVSYGVGVVLKENCRVSYISSLKSNMGFCYYNADIGANSEIKWLNSVRDGKFLKVKIFNELNGECARVKTASMSRLNNKSQADIHIVSRHNNKLTYSDALSKGIVKDNSKLLLRGLTRVEKNAAQSDGYERADVLIFDNAEADAIPNLEIENHDVKCSHGASIGQIDKDKLFYLMSKGLKEEDANELIISGFFEPLFKFYSGNINEIKEVIKC